MAKVRVTVIEDDMDLVSVLRFNLEQAGYEVRSYRDGAEGLAGVLADPPDILLVDRQLPALEGTEICSRLRASERCMTLPIIMISVKNHEADKVLGLGLGADDYLTKPFGIAELEARVKALLRRTERGTHRHSVSLVRQGPLSIDLDTFSASLDGETLILTPTEFRMLHALASSPGLVFTRDNLKDMAISDDVIVMDHNIDVHIASIRKKLGVWRGMIETVWGVGYRFRIPSDDTESGSRAKA